MSPIFRVAGARPNDPTQGASATGRRRGGSVAVAIALVALTSLLGAANASANFAGAIYTTEADCTTVNGNIYTDKEAVYLNGGPQNDHANGLPADQLFYVKVTEPDNTPLSSLSSPGTITSNSVGVLPCSQLWSLVTSYATPGSQGYDTTTNNGKEYKVWISTESGFPNDASKTDNFKVYLDETPPTAAADLTVSKNTAAAFDRTFAWSIAKAVDKTSVKQVGGGTATFNYTVTVDVTGHTDGNYTVSGQITVNNPNLVAVPNVTVADDDSHCTISTPHTGVTVAAGPNTFDYTCSYPDATTTSNSATVSWATSTLSDLSVLVAGSATTGNVPINWNVNPNLIHDCVTVTDTQVPAGLGTVCTTDTLPAALKYSKNLAVPVNGCQTYNNTATFTTNGTVPATGNASQTVTTCGPAATGALTIGFWKNTNGNTLIQYYCAPSGKQSLQSYLVALGGSGPFANAPATCSALVTWVNNIIKGATATDMNVMLKAQMLATALDVYFSDPSKGWTSTTVSGKKPPSNFLPSSPLGGFVMDMTAVCPMVDNTTTGTATCKNNTPSTDAVASGAFPSAAMSVQAILEYASTSPSPYSAGVWYAGNRTKQEIAKNVFDQINNQLAFAA